MKVALDQIKASPTPLRYHEEAAALNARLHEGSCAGDDFRFPGGLDAALEHYRAGLDVVFEGGLQGEAEGTCARCLEPYPFPFELPLRVLLAPRATAGDDDDEDREFGFFDGDEIDVTRFVVEEAILGLPTIPLCTDGCRGLCPRCGINRNLHSCTCVPETSQPTSGLAALAGLKVTDVTGGR